MKSKLSNFYIRSSIFSIFSAGAALINYLLYPALSHILDTAGFGNFTALNALSTQILGILLAFNLTSVYIVKTYSESDARSNAQAIQRILIWAFVAVSCLFLILSSFLGDKLHIANTGGFLVVTLLLFSTVPAVIWTGYLQGHKQLIQVGIFNFAAAISKFVFALIFGALLGATGGLLGVLAGTILGLLILRLSTKRKLPSIISIFHRLNHTQVTFLHSVKYYVAGSVLIVGGLTILQNLDITYAKYFFSPEIAGAYSGISILSNALYYIFFLLIWIIIPEIDPIQSTHNRRLLGNTYKLIFGIGSGALLVVYIFQDLIVRVLMGSEFLQFSSLLIYGVLYQIGLVAITFYAYYLLILRDHKSALLAICTIIPTAVIPHFFSNSPQTLITSLVFSLYAGFGIYLIFNLLLNVRRKYV